MLLRVASGQLDCAGYRDIWYMIWLPVVLMDVFQVGVLFPVT